MTDIIKDIAHESRMAAVRDVAKKLLAFGDDVEKVSQVTGLRQDEVEEIRKNLR